MAVSSSEVGTSDDADDDGDAAAAPEDAGGC
jgi:hypothetical protein